MAKQDEQLLLSLSSWGLSRREASVYLSALELGRGTVTQISRKAGINRTTGYDILDRLAGNGLVRISGKEPKQEYVAESPDNILTLLQNRQKLLEKSIAAAEDFIPKLKSIQKIEDRPQIKFYEGIEGLKQVYEDTLTSSEKIVAYAKYEEMFEALGDYFPLYYKRRAQKGIPIRAIIPKTPMAIEQSTHDKEVARETAFVPPDDYSFSPEINVYDNKVMIASWKEKLGIIIESAEIADAMKKIFNLAWAEAKRLNASGI